VGSTVKKILILFFVVFLCDVFADNKTEVKTEFSLPNGAKITIIQDIFDEKKFKLDKCGDMVCFINGHIPQGTEYIPETYVKSIKVHYQGEVYSLDSSDMYNALRTSELYSSMNSKRFGGQCKDKYNCTFRGIFADAAATFTVEWKIIRGKSYRTIMTFSHDIIYFIMENLEPDAYYK
jgi:hypothetical protein